MSLSAPKPPPAPNPAATSAAQTQSNKETALYNWGLDNPNWYTPMGSMGYNIDTSNPNQPRVTGNLQLSPEQQQLYDQQTQQSIALSNLANALQSRVGTSLSEPIATSADINKLSKDAQDAYYNSQATYLDPQYNKLQSNNDAKLAAEGIVRGTAAYNNAQSEFARQRDEAYGQARNQAILAGPQNAQQLFSLTSAARNQPLNEFNALRSGSQVSMPTFQGYNGPTMAGTDVAGNINRGYQNQLDIYNQRVGSQNQMMGNLFGLGGSLGSAFLMSDRRLKTNVVFIGKTKGGVPIYKYKYIGESKENIGTMADKVRHIPGAVIRTASGFEAVDYRRIH